MKQTRLGSYPEMSLVQARNKLLKFKSMKANGVDPQDFIKLEEEKLKTQALEQAISDKKEAFTFRAMVDLYLSQKVLTDIVNLIEKGGGSLSLAVDKKRGRMKLNEHYTVMSCLRWVLSQL